MILVETPVFTRRVTALLNDEEYRLLQLQLVARPQVGALIRGSGGLRKARRTLASRGKRSGVRVIYYWSRARDRIVLLLIYSKSERDDLTASQLAVLRRLVQAEHLESDGS